MQRPRDPVEESAGDGRDLYEVSTWEPRSRLDRLSVGVYRLLLGLGRILVVTLALGLLVSQFVAGGMSPVVSRPEVLVLVGLSVVPALLLTGYVWLSDVTSREPLGLLGVTFLFGVLFATFAAVVNSIAQQVLAVAALGAIGFPIFFYLVVGPVEESVKLLAVRMRAYGSYNFDSVADGAVYGAVAGLGFATIENLLYISTTLGEAGGGAVIGLAGGITAVRALAGPGHVIYSAVAGYYLGLAKFNRRNFGPIVVKGLLIAAFLHGTYNTLVGIVPGLANALVAPLGQFTWFVVFIVVYDGLLLLYLLRKLQRYARLYRDVRPADHAEGDLQPERTEFERPVDGESSRVD